MENYCGAMPTIGQKAPSFEANTTQGPIKFPEDYEGKWVILFSHPSDFTPVCTSEFVTFGNLYEQFKKLNCELLGLSVDGLQSHIAWLRTIEEKIEFNGMKQIEVRFPLIEDLSMEVARKYGMIQPEVSDTKAVRTVFFIDPKGIVRASICYPMQLGRNFDEIKRALIGLQTIDAFSVSLPADWTPGADVIMPSPKSLDEANSRMKDIPPGEIHNDWFFCLKKLSKDQVEEKLGLAKKED